MIEIVCYINQLNYLPMETSIHIARLKMLSTKDVISEVADAAILVTSLTTATVVAVSAPTIMAGASLFLWNYIILMILLGIIKTLIFKLF